MIHAKQLPSKSFKAKWVPKLRAVHKAMAYLSALALLCWGLSGVLHPLISTFGVQQAVFMPPQIRLNLQDAKPIDRILREAQVAEARSIRVVAGQVPGGETQSMLQVTEQAFQPRRYFDLKTGQEIPGQDLNQAVFLARHFLRINQEEPSQTEWIDKFSTEYPSVNRLLPVYKVSFEGRNGLHAYIYTETNSVAGVSDTPKQWAQTAFQWFHTWSWLPEGAETMRILLMSCLLSGLLGMGLSGLSMLVLVRRKRAAKSSGHGSSSRTLLVHRFAAGLLVLPVLGFAGSGIYHLWVMGWPGSDPVIRLPEPLTTADLQDGLQAPITENWNTWTKGLEVNALSIVANPGSSSELYYRLGLKLNTMGQGIPILPDQIRHARFSGTPVSGPALYLDARTGQPARMDDKTLALLWAQKYAGQSSDAIEQAKLVTRFGGDYDFRNKRLPVWQIDVKAPNPSSEGSSLFIDTSTGVLVDVTPNNQKPERWSFNTLHKWNFMAPLGRNTQNLATGLTALLAVIFLAGLGFRLKFKSRVQSR